MIGSKFDKICKILTYCKYIAVSCYDGKYNCKHSINLDWLHEVIVNRINLNKMDSHDGIRFDLIFIIHKNGFKCHEQL